MTKTKIMHRGEDYITVIHHDEEYEITGGTSITLIESMIKEQEENEVEMIRELVAFVYQFASNYGVRMEYLVHGKRKENAQG